VSTLAVEAHGAIEPDRILETHLARVLAAAQREQRTGVLTLDEGSIPMHVHVVDGKVVFVEHGPIAQTLGRMLVSDGKLDAEEYRVILERMAEPAKAENEVLRFGAAALSLGMIEPGDLNAALSLQVERKLAHALRCDEGKWKWRDDESARRHTPYPTRFEPTLLAALRDDAQRWIGVLAGKRNRRATLLESADAAAHRFGASPQELRVMRTIDGRPIASLLSNGILEPEETAALLVALVLVDAAQIGPHISEPVPKRPSVEAKVEKPESKRAPDRGADVRARDAADRLREEMRKRGRAPRTQSARLDAERAFDRGKRMLAQGFPDKAREALEQAVGLLPEAAEYVLYLRFCQYVSTEDPLVRVVYEQELRAAVLEALSQDRRMAFAHYVQGRLFMVDGDERAASRALTLASKLDPNDVEIERYLRVLRRRLE
jgi:hypothetical protein